MKAQELEQAVNNSTDMFLLAAKECGFTTPEEIENNFEIIALVAGEMVKHSKERIITKLNTNPMWLKYLAAKYYKRVNG